MELCKNAASIAVDSVFSNVFAKLNDGEPSMILGSEGSPPPAFAPESSSPRTLLDLPDDEEHNHSAQWAIQEELGQFDKEEEKIMRQKTKRMAERYSKTTDLLRRAQVLEAQMKLKRSDVEQLEGQEKLSADGIDFPTEEQALVQRAAATDSEMLDGMVASGGRRMMEEAGYVSPEELDVDMRKHLAAQKRLRKKKKAIEEKKARRLAAEAAEQEMLRRNLEQNEERRKRIAAEHERERKRLLEERVAQSKEERRQRQREREQLKNAERRMKKVKPKPLYKRMEEEFEEKILMPELVRRKEKLAAIHKRFKESSPALADIDMHQRAVQAQERLNRERARLKKRGREKLWTQSQQYYTGQTKMHVIEEHKTQLSQAQMKLREKKMIRAKQKAYGEFVRKVAAPRLDPDKQLEMESRIARLKNPAPLRKDKRENELVYGAGARGRATPSPPREPRPPRRETAEELYRRTRKPTGTSRREDVSAPTHRMRSRDEELETARFLGAKEQAKEDMRIRRERRRQKALANRGHSEDTESAGASTIAANERHERAVEARREKEARYQALADKDGAISPDVTREADAHTKLSNMYMDAMQAKMDELNSMES